MVYLTVFRFIIFTTCILSSYGLKLTPCELHDLTCFKQMFRSYLNQTWDGIPAYDIKPIDPLHIPSLIMNLYDDDEAKMHFNNLVIKGLNEEKLINFELSLKNRTVMFETEEKINVASDLTISFSETSKTFSGLIKFKGSALINAISDFIIAPDCIGVEHFYVSPASMTCQTLGKLKVFVSPELRDVVNEENPLYGQYIRSVFCNIVKKAWSTVMHNIRVGSKILPKGEILKTNECLVYT